ncbi:MAG: ThuA domain-containing protein [Microbacterium sp.]
MSEPTAIILSGAGRYADPWHPFARTSARIAGILQSTGLRADVVPDVDEALEGWGSSGVPHLVVANLGRPQDEGAVPETTAARRGLEKLLETAPVLAFHASANAFHDVPAWTRRIGGRWVPGVSHHPPLGQTLLEQTSQSFLEAERTFVVTDESYRGLEVRSDVCVHFEHVDEAGGRFPALWTTEKNGLRAAYDSLGHDERSFEDRGHVRALRAVVRWLVEA